MSYRFYLNDTQLLGNNECPDCVMKELKRQGCKMDGDNCFYNFEIKDFDGFMHSLEEYITEQFKDSRGRMCDFTDNFSNAINEHSLTYVMLDIVDYAYMFVTVNALNAIGNENYLLHIDFDDEGHMIEKFELKPGVKAIVEAY